MRLAHTENVLFEAKFSIYDDCRLVLESMTETWKLEDQLAWEVVFCAVVPHDTF